ncbi:Heavy metal transport/detoxification superfamily protein [Tripterygium wilfordii]|uniref:Heavy metal transport/detoxification superfamily protein n=1 Tax=Tripterygium wilfordii TaxID=458696 RepID=A0A7J7DUD5_TRIWF|nr:heavy metal-associated isoprenylated plant protein 21 [Tripterygium wilfordii]KAF5749982.1 Heavy metal transport/detoxification superfamily protein [Tripterygium wilfordii]
MGALDYLSNFCTVTSIRRSKRKPMQTVEIKVKMDCDGCERRVKHAVTSMKGVKTVEVIRKQSRVKVSGYVDPNKVLKRVKSRTGKRAEFWPYIPQHLVYYPYVAGVYDKRAPSGYVRNVVQAFPATSSSSTGPEEERIVSLFSDDNVHACSIM